MLDSLPEPLSCLENPKLSFSLGNVWSFQQRAIMYIDTAAANRRLGQPRIVVSPRYAAPYTQSQTPLLDEPLDDRDAPPTYLEATTPGLYYGRPSGDEGATLLNAEEQRYKEDAYSTRSFRQSLRTKWTKWLGITMLLIFVFAAGVAFTTSARKGKQVSKSKISANTDLIPARLP